jgi:AraC-type DNA-binding domain-containing proteins
MIERNHIEFSKSIIKGVEIKQSWNTPYDYKPHVHKELSLGYILEGSTDLTLSDRIIHYEKGNGVVIPPMTTHRCAPKDIEHWAYFMLFIEPDYYNELINFNITRKLEGDEVLKLIEFIDLLLEEKNPNSLENILIELLIEFGEGTLLEIETETSNIKLIHEYILNHLYEVITLEYLQEISNLNKFTLIRNFKKEYVTTPAAFHLQCRVSEAKRLLSNGSDVLEVCNLLNFCDQAHLIREFKKMYGTTPTTYIEQLKK